MQMVGHSLLQSRQQALPQAADALLRSFLNATDEAESQALLTRLISEYAEPIIKEILEYKLHVHFKYSQYGSQLQDAEDVRSEVVLRLLKRLRDEKKPGARKDIRDVCAYVAVTTFHTYYEHLRKKHLQRWRLKDKLRHFLTRRKDFLIWKREKNQWLCWMADGSHLKHKTHVALTEPSWDGNQPAPAIFSIENAERLELAELLRAILERAGRPVSLDVLVDTVAELRGDQSLPEQPEILATAAEAWYERPLDPSRFQEREVSLRLYLQRLWTEICQLPLKQRQALLLNLKDGQRRSHIALLPLTGTATIRQIAETLGIADEQFATLWNLLPLDDETIAQRLCITRQQVINLRKSARERLARRMRLFEREIE
jgi:hypothetical protein